MARRCRAPMVVWHSKFLEEADWVGAEFFDFARLDNFIRRAEVLLNTFAQFKLLVVQIVEAEKTPRFAKTKIFSCARLR